MLLFPLSTIITVCCNNIHGWVAEEDDDDDEDDGNEDDGNEDDNNEDDDHDD